MTNTSNSTENFGKYSKIFQLIDKAGGVKLKDYNKLTPREKSEISFNIYAFFFGIFYYLVKGMWKKGFVLLVICIGIVEFLKIIASMLNIPVSSQILFLVNFVIQGAIFGNRAFIDLYKKHKLNENGWI